MDRNAWLKWRHSGLGSSDAPVIMGVSSWKTALQLYEEKILPEPKEDSTNYWIKNKGNEIEDKIRKQFEILHGNVEWAPCMIEDSDFHFMKATLDGRSPDKTEFVEIKLLGKEDFEFVVLTGCVPVKYYPQVMHQFIVSQCRKGWFAAYQYEQGVTAYDSSRLKIIEVPLNKEYCDKLFVAEVKFWDGVVSHRSPLPSDKDWKQLRGVSTQVNRWKKLKLKIQELESEQEQMRKIILEAAELDGHPRLICAGISILKISSQGTVDYKRLMNDKGITEEEADKYRKGGRVSWKFDIIEKRNVQ